jgi:hypothetical protein
MVTIGLGYATTGINACIFRRSSLVTHGDTQYAAYYDPEGRVVVAQRRHGTEAWRTHVTQHSGNVHDVHNVISLGVDGTGLLHVSWDHHSHALNYCRAVAPGSAALTDRLPLTGDEDAVTYPQFYPLPGGDLLFQCRNVVAGSCHIVFRRYDARCGRWRALSGPVLSGEGVRGPYWQTAVDPRTGAIHLSWCWAELDGRPGYEPDHDVCYARSDDGGLTWQHSTGEPYDLPITLANAEVAVPVAEHTNLGNMTSMAADSRGRPLVAQHWRPEGEDTEQLFLIHHDGTAWQTQQVGQRLSHALDLTREDGFTLSRPLIVVDRHDRAHVVVRDAARGNGVTVYSSQGAGYRDWACADLITESLGEWEPTCDWGLWERDNVLHLLVQTVSRHCPPEPVTREAPPEPVSVLEWRP